MQGEAALGSHRLDAFVNECMMTSSEPICTVQWHSMRESDDSACVFVHGYF